ncbi:MAG: GNAT family N-acetyltransferase [Acidobacteriota bacterium]
MKIIQAETPEQIDAARRLFREYETSMDLDLCFQGFEAELAELPGKYALPRGRLLIAFIDKDAAGCIALRDLGDGVCEMKRLFVRSRFRGQKVGRYLIEQVIRNAREIGYSRMRLDTAPAKMAKAVQLYESHGFREIPAYYDNPNEDVIYLEIVL